LKSFLEKVQKYGLGMGIERVPISMVESDNVDNLVAIEGNEEVPLHDYWKDGLIQHEMGLKQVADLVKFTVDQGFIFDSPGVNLLIFSSESFYYFCDGKTKKIRILMSIASHIEM
jgi:hypothetical protein